MREVVQGERRLAALRAEFGVGAYPDLPASALSRLFT
jgi:hypothetical protein